MIRVGMPLYHCSLAWLEPGSVIRPGNYGRVVRIFGPSTRTGYGNNSWSSCANWSFLTSHLAFAFACENLAAAQFFKETSCPSGIIYEVDMTDSTAKTHVTDFNCIQPARGKIEDMHEVARHYWAGSYWFDVDGRPGLKCAETLVESGLRVVAELA